MGCDFAWGNRDRRKNTKRKKVLHVPEKKFQNLKPKVKTKLTKEVEEKVESPSSSVMPDNGTVEPFPDFNHNLGHFGKMSPLFPANNP